MTTSVAQHPAGAQSPAGFAAGQREAFCGMNLHVGRSHVVHAVAWVDWIDGLLLPVPACRTGFSGHGVHAELRPSARVVSCLRCRRAAGEDQAPAGPCDPLLLF
jgi:hypothetical protein